MTEWYLTFGWLAVAVALVVCGLAVGMALTRARWAARCAAGKAECDRLAAERDFLQRQVQQLESQKEETVKMLKAGYEEAKGVLAERLREQEERWREQQKTAVEQFRALSTQALADNARQLKATNHEQMAALLQPLKEQISGLGQAVQQSNTSHASNTASLSKMIELVAAKAERLSTDAEHLSRALRGDSKKQGDWGEMVLERMLEESGLKKGEEYYTQQVHTTDDGRHLRPDVVVRFPEGRSVVIDSKVSLTAYATFAAAEDDEARAAALAAHVASVRRHMDELAEKDYSAVVKESVGYVLMFVPNEASYIAAVQAQPELPLEGYRKRVLMISPTNLLMALQLAYNLWQKERQSRNVEAIFAKAAAIYDKCALLTESFEDVGKNLRRAMESHEQAMSRFNSGRGNLTRQVEDLRQMGVSTSKRLSLTDE